MSNAKTSRGKHPGRTTGGAGNKRAESSSDVAAEEVEAGPEIEVDVTALAAGGDGVARDAGGRVTFVPRTTPGDRVRVRLVKQTKSFARGELVAILTASAARIDAPCEYFVAGCGGCQWQHVTRDAQLAAKHAIVAGALRNLPGLVVEPVADPAPAYGWRRRARFHVVGGKLGLYAAGSHRVIALDHVQAVSGARCPQLEPALDAALSAVAAATPPDGEVTVARGHTGAIVVGVEKPWKLAGKLVGRAGIVGVVAGDTPHGEIAIELEPGLVGGPRDFAQASAAGNAALIERVRVGLGRGPGQLLELHAGAGNFTRGFVEDGWDVLYTDVETPAQVVEGARFERASAERAVTMLTGPFDAVVLDPPRTGAPDAIAGLVRLAPKAIVYVSCDPATLARDAAGLVAAGYRAERAWPIDLMPQTSHVEVVLRLVR